MKITATIERWPLRKPFRISRREVAESAVLHVRVEADGASGQGEAAGASYKGETVESMAAEVASLAARLEGPLTREALAGLLPASGARNALDCALWDLELSRAGTTIWDRLGLRPAPVETAYTIGLDTREAMIADALQAEGRTLLKLKIDRSDPAGTLRALKAARPDARFIVDANEALTARTLSELLPDFARAGVVLIEQPLPRGEDEALEQIRSPIPLCADESCQTREGLKTLARRYQLVNIKLDKTGGLTEALALAGAARELGLGIMVGCMLGTSLAMAPAFVLAQGARFVDLDGPLLLARDRAPAIPYAGGRMGPLPAGLWGHPAI
ncbi:MAG: dipeptide epimerase [Alphaproteobacteria bacterium]|nr:dipeptide epimerase [Alphaproteobacteria bacterium]